MTEQEYSRVEVEVTWIFVDDLRFAGRLGDAVLSGASSLAILRSWSVRVEVLRRCC